MRTNSTPLSGAALLLVALLFALVSASVSAGAIEGRFVVKLKQGRKEQVTRMALAPGAKFERLSPARLNSRLDGAEVWERYFIYSGTGGSLTEQDVIEAIGAENIEAIEPDHTLEFFDFPSDPLFAHQWYLYNYGQTYYSIARGDNYGDDSLVLSSGTSGADINLHPFYLAAPSETTRVVVAIVDSGVDTEHPELAGRLWRNADEIPANGRDDDHNGFIDDTLGYDVSGDRVTLFDPVGDNDPTDKVGHGTHLAGIVAAGANGVGVVGIAPWAEIMPVKIQPNATTSVGAAGIIYAVNAGAQVINISWGTPFESGVLRDALRFARRNNVFACVAAGNSGTNQRYFPAAYDSSFVVAAGNSHGFMTEFSTFGAHIDIVAPGQDMLSLRAAGTDMYASAGEPLVRIIGPDSLYYLADGTSMSAPTVAGAAAFLLSVRPDLSVREVEELLLLGAEDIVDPWNEGDFYIGPDTISGWGNLSVAGAMDLLQRGGLQLVAPVHRLRYTEDILVKVRPVSGYTGGWQLDYSWGMAPGAWHYLAAGNSVPADSVVYVFDSPDAEGYLTFRITDKYGAYSYASCTYVRQRRTEILTPLEGSEQKYNIPIYGNVYGPDYDSMSVWYRRHGAATKRLTKSTGEYFDSLLYPWAVSGVDTGQFTVTVFGHFGLDTLRDSVRVHVSSAFAAGWPRSVGVEIGITPVCADLDHDGSRELIVTSVQGIYVFGPTGTLRPGFPVLGGRDTRCIPAIYDVDRDGFDEIIATSDSGLHVVRHDGASAAGWPNPCYTGLIPYGYGYPNPTVTRLGMGEDSAIVIINRLGQILAYKFNGDPYFFSLGGLFAAFDSRLSESAAFGGAVSPFVSGVDVTGDGINEVLAAWESPLPWSGLGFFDGRTGRPAFDSLDPVVERIPTVTGVALTDFDGDDIPETVLLGRDSSGMPRIWVKHQGRFDLPGWPVAMPAVSRWIGSYPVPADLDLDGSPEIMCAFFEYDVGVLYIFRADGTPYVNIEGRPAGEAFAAQVTFGTPIAANITGDQHPEIIMRSGYILPGTGREYVYLLDHRCQPVPGWPIPTPSQPREVFSSRMAPLIDDLDGDGLVEMILLSDAADILVWDFDASLGEGSYPVRFLGDNLNSGVYRLGTGATGSPDAQARRMEPVK